jgi:spherulation-specific family 4 protein
VTPRTLLAVRKTDFAAPQRVSGGLAVVESQPGTDRADLVNRLTRITNAGLQPLGHVSLGYGFRPLAEIRDEIARWAQLPVAGLFVDHAPAGPYQVGPVVSAIRAARRARLDPIVLNPGIAVDQAYRRLDAILCTFDGTWLEYVALPAGRCRPGDGHLVYDVPAADLRLARELAAARGASLLLLSEHARPAFETTVTQWSGPDEHLWIRGQRRPERSANLTP